MPFVNFASLGVPGNAVSRGGVAGATTQIQTAFNNQFGRQANQSELDQILSGANLDIPDIPSSGSTGTNNQANAKPVITPSGVQPTDSSLTIDPGTGQPHVPAGDPPIPGADGINDLNNASGPPVLTPNTDPNANPTGFDDYEALGQFNVTKLPTTQDPLWNVRDRNAGFEKGMQLFPPTRYGTAAANAFANLVAQGRGPRPGQTSVWWRDVFIPELERVKANQSTEVTVHLGGDPSGPSGDLNPGNNIVAQLQALFENAGFNIGPGQFNLPDPSQLFSGITGGITDVNQQLGNITAPGSELLDPLRGGITDVNERLGNITAPGADILNPLNTAITGAGTRLQGLGNVAGRLALPDKFLRNIESAIWDLNEIKGFQAPTAFGDFGRDVRGTLGDIGEIGRFQRPEAFNTFETDVNTLLGRLGETGELGQGIERGIAGVGDIQQAVDDLLKGSFRGEEGLFSELAAGDFRVGNLGRALQALQVPDLNLGGLTEDARGLRDVIGQGQANIEGLEGALGGDVLQNLISALSGGNIGELQSILEQFRGPENVTVQGGLTEQQLAQALQPLATGIGIGANRLGPEGDIYRMLSGLGGRLGGLEGLLGPEGLGGDISNIQGGVTGLERLLGPQGLGGGISNIQDLISGPGGVQQTVSGIPEITDIQTALGKLNFLTPENLPEALRGQFPGMENLTQLDQLLSGSEYAEGLQSILTGIEGIPERVPQPDMSGITSALEGLGGGGGDLDLGPILEAIRGIGGRGPDLEDNTGFLKTIQDAITGNIGLPDPNAAELRANPQTASLLADFAKRREEIEAQNEERLKRFGVLRGGDSISQLLRDQEATLRGEFDILGDAAGRAQALRAGAIGQGTGLGSLMAQRELGLGGLLGEVGGRQTLGGRESDLNTMAGIIAALDPKLDLDTKSNRQLGLAEVLAGLLPEGLRADFMDRVVNAGRGAA
jgi:hypothetical protein